MRSEIKLSLIFSRALRKIRIFAIAKINYEIWTKQTTIILNGKAAQYF